MSHSIEKRYVAHSQIQPLSGGALYYGQDRALPRDILLYHSEHPKGEAKNEYAQTIRKASTLNHNGFQHILDTSFDEASVLVVLQHRPGNPLSQELRTRIWTYQKILQLAAGVGLAMLDAMEEQIAGYAISADNLWLGEDGRLSFLNYWEKGEPSAQGAIGLCGLMLQLFSGSAHMPSPCDSAGDILSKVGLFQATAEQKEAIARLIRRVCEGRVSLSAFVFELKGMHDQLAFAASKPNGEQPKPAPQPAAPSKEPAPAAPAASEYAEDASREQAPPPPREPRAERQQEPRQPAKAKTAPAPAPTASVTADSDDEDNKPSFAKKAIVIVSALIVVSFLVWVFWPRSAPDRRPLFESSPSPSGSSATTGPSGSGKPQASAKPTSPSPSPTPPPAAADGTVPNLLGLDQDSAGKAAIAAGYRYNFIKEENEKPTGTVFRQTPEPGTAAPQGGNITFWVSKGSGQ